MSTKCQGMIFLHSETYISACGGGLSERILHEVSTVSVNDPLRERTRPRYLKESTYSMVLPLYLNTSSFFGEFENATTLDLFFY